MDSYAVIGHPIAHSQSPKIHAEFAKQTKQNLSYVAIEAPIDGFFNTLKDFEAAGGKGCNVTLPFKTEAFEIADSHSQLAIEAGAANTLVFKDNKIFADSTDGPGLIQDITNNHHYSLRQKKILILGAGGVVKCIAGPLLAQAPASLVIANRTVEKAERIAKQFEMRGEIDSAGLSDIPDEPFDLIINATSASINGKVPAISTKLISKQTWCYDLFYSKQATAFLTWAKQLGAAECIDGLGMLVEQAAAAFYLWRGVYPETKSVIAMLRNSQNPK
ncbi:MAG: shikimate dehydrogenase [Coxiellaceae bacterium]|nr:shikimate dehydrogenase [Coxiellaceae bacterium]